MWRWSFLSMLVVAGGVRAQAGGYYYQQRAPLPGDTLPLPPMNAPPAPRPPPENPDRWLEGVSVLFGGGVEAYTGSLSSRLALGPAWTFILGIHPSSVFGIELAYQGALQSLKNGDGSGNSGRADIIRHAGQANVTFAFGPWQVQPFVLAGVGINHYSVSDQAKAVGFSEGTGGYIPVAAGSGSASAVRPWTSGGAGSCPSATPWPPAERARTPSGWTPATIVAGTPA